MMTKQTMIIHTSSRQRGSLIATSGGSRPDITAMTVLCGTLPIRLSLASREWMGGQKIVSSRRRDTEPSRLQLPPPRTRQSDYSTSEIPTFQRGNGSQVRREGRRGGDIHMPSATTLREAIAVLKNRQQQGNTIDPIMLVEVLKRCLKQKDLEAVRQVHHCMIQTQMDKNSYLANNLLNAYIKCGALEDARRVFDALEKKTLVTWNTMIGGYTKTDQADAALEVFNRMRQAGAHPNELTYLSILKGCVSPSALQWGKEVHSYITHAGLESDVRVGTALIQMYAKCGCITEARQVFERLASRNLITWNVMIGAYAKSGCGKEAYQLFLQMKREGFIPDEFTYTSILDGAANPASAGALEWVKTVHTHALDSGLDSDLRVGNALIHMYAKSGSIDDARQIFTRMGNRDVVTWNTMIGALAEIGCGVEAYKLFLRMKLEGCVPDGFTYASILNASAGGLEWVKEVHSSLLKAGHESDLRVGNALVHMYAKSGSLQDARLVFDRMGERDVITWNIIIGAYAEKGCGEEAYQLFLQMNREGYKADSVTYMSILNPSTSAGALEWVKGVHSHAIEGGMESEMRVGNALVHMYAKSGNIEDARLVFDRMGGRDVVAFNIMINGLAQHGCGNEALELFRRMVGEGVKPDGASFVAVLSACCHAGLVDDGQRLFSSMAQEFGVNPTVMHYTCMVDLLGRAGRLEEAKRLICDIPVKPDGVTWHALLSACRTYGNVELGELAAGEVLKREPGNASAYVLLSNIYAGVGEWEKVSSVRTLMQQRGVRKEPGRSWIEVDSKVHEFVVGDTCHPEAGEIYAELDRLSDKLRVEGYVPDTQLVLRNIDEGDKELALCSHGERLAIVYGLMRVPRGKPIRVYKNLRVCSDCHTATRFISKVTGREIIARDSNRFHHFKDGVCSCGDYW